MKEKIKTKDKIILPREGKRKPDYKGSRHLSAVRYKGSRQERHDRGRPRGQAPGVARHVQVPVSDWIRFRGEDYGGTAAFWQLLRFLSYY